MNVPDGTSVPSITGVYPAAFVFENESHDLFGVSFEDISIDFGGEFYTVAVAYPMNPRAAACTTTGPTSPIPSLSTQAHAHTRYSSPDGSWPTDG